MSKAVTSLDQLRDQPDHELRQALARTRDELFRLHLAQHTNQVTSTAALLGKRREIARILTILRARELGVEAQGQKTQTRPAAKSSQTPQAKS
jgi:large subunit ribosomal protein L29